MTSDLKERTKPTVKRFSCGGHQFGVAPDPETGRWDHDQHAARTLACLGKGETVAFDAVDALCELLSEGAVEIGQGIKAAQCVVKFKAGIKANPSRFYPEFALIYLMLMADGKLDFEHTIRPDFHLHCQPDNAEVRSRRFGHFRLDYGMGAIPSQSAWLRASMRTALRDFPKREATPLCPDLVVAAFAINIDKGWCEDGGLWAEYADWASERRNISEPMLYRALLYREGYEDIPDVMAKDPNDPYRVLFNVMRSRRDADRYHHEGAFLESLGLYLIS